MAISINSNIASLQAQTQLNKTTRQLSSTFQRLSSGLRINSAADDPGSLAIFNKLDTDTKIAAVAIRNTNDGISLASVADDALSEIGNVLQRMVELATQSANETYSMSQRSAFSSEFLALGSEVQRIAVTTTFNGIALLSNATNITLQVGLDGTSNSRISLRTANATLHDLGLATSGSSALTYSVISTSTDASVDAATAAITALNSAISTLSSTRGKIGAYESRLNTSLNVLEVTKENYAAAAHAIADADIASETTNLIRLQILQQSQVAVLAQANQQPQNALKLLG